MPETPATVHEPEQSQASFERFPGWKTYLLLLILPLSSVLLYELVDPAARLAEFAKGALNPAVETVGWLTGVALTLAPIAALIPLVAKLHRTFGGARWDERGLFLRGPVLKDEVFLPWESVQTVEPTSHGVRIVPTKAAAPGLWTFYPFKPLIPVESAERDRVLEEVAQRVGEVQEGRIFGYTPHSWRSALIAFLIALPCVVAVMFASTAVVHHAWGIAADYLVLGSTLATLVVGVGGALYSTSAFLTRIELHRDLLSCASYPFPFEELRASIRGQVAWFERPGRRRRGYLRPEEGPALKAALEAAGVAVDERPPWRASSAGVLLQTGSLLGLGLLAGFVPAIWASLQPAHDVDQMMDPFRQGLVVVHERWTARPVHLVLCEDPQVVAVVGREAYGKPGSLVHGGDFGLDAIRSTWAANGGQRSGSLAPLTSLVGSGGEARVEELSLAPEVLSRLQDVIREGSYSKADWPHPPGPGGVLAIPQAVRGNGRTVPAFLEELVGVPEGQLGDYVLGRTSKRFFDVQAADGELVAAVSRGRVLWVVLLPVEVGVQLVGQGFGYATALGAPAVQVEPGISRSNLTGALEQLRPRSPSLSQLLEARRRIKAGEASAVEALDWLQRQPE